MGDYKHKARGVSALTRHIASPAKYRRAAIGGEADYALKEAREEAEKRCGINFLETGAEGDRARFPARPAPAYSPTKTVGAIRSAAAGYVDARGRGGGR
ncbi:MAG: transposase [Treponema sp.]|jgi:hypothetical protein|nr:transposase [Treponema sp.]